MGGGVHLYVCGMCVVYVWLIDAGGVGVVVSPQGGDRWEIASGRSTSGRCQGVAPTVPGEGGRPGRRELDRQGIQGRQGIRVSWMWRGGAGAPRVPWRASLGAGGAGQSKQAVTLTDLHIGVTRSPRVSVLRDARVRARVPSGSQVHLRTCMPMPARAG